MADFRNKNCTPKKKCALFGISMFAKLTNTSKLCSLGHEKNLICNKHSYKREFSANFSSAAYFEPQIGGVIMGNSVWTNSKFQPNRIPEYYSYTIFDRIEYLNYSDTIIRIIRIIRKTFKMLKLGQITLKKVKKS